MIRIAAVVILTAALTASVAGATPGKPVPSPQGVPPSQRIPLNDLGAGKYMALFQGGLYPGGSNVSPADHAYIGSTAARRIMPRDTNGTPSPSGRVVMLSIGMSSASQEFCSGDSYSHLFWAGLPVAVSRVCATWTFGGRAWTDASVEKVELEILDGAQSGMASGEWGGAPRPGAGDPWAEVATRLALVGLSAKQVQVAWLKLATPDPRVSLPSQGADAYVLLTRLGNAVRTAKQKYPNLQIVFVSSRTYGGYATTGQNPEPYAYESGFAVKWLIQAQILEMQGGPTDPLAGPLNPTAGVAPWLAWGPYLWADGVHPRSDGLIWVRSDFEADGTHPTQNGEWKVSSLLLDFMKTAGIARCWFVASQACH